MIRTRSPIACTRLIVYAALNRQQNGREACLSPESASVPACLELGRRASPSFACEVSWRVRQEGVRLVPASGGNVHPNHWFPRSPPKAEIRRYSVPPLTVAIYAHKSQTPHEAESYAGRT